MERMEPPRKCPDCGKMHNCGWQNQKTEKMIEPIAKCYNCLTQEMVGKLRKKVSHEFSKYWKEPNDN